jgi:hypothetical protein
VKDRHERLASNEVKVREDEAERSRSLARDDERFRMEAMKTRLLDLLGSTVVRLGDDLEEEDPVVRAFLAPQHLLEREAPVVARLRLQLPLRDSWRERERERKREKERYIEHISGLLELVKGQVERAAHT